MPRIRPAYQSRTTLLPQDPLCLVYEAVTLYGLPFQKVRQTSRVHTWPTSIRFCNRKFGLPCAGFTRVTYGIDILSLPACTKIFQFHAYARTTIHGAHLGYPGFKGRHAPTPGLSQLATPFVATRAKPSTRWLSYKLASPQINCNTCNLTSIYGNPSRGEIA